MPPVVNVIGNSYGSLTVIRAISKRSKSGNVFWCCLCECGNYVHVNSGNLPRAKSCGCLTTKSISKANRKDIAGRRYGKLIALYPLDRRVGGHVIWACRCECGKTAEVNITSLVQGDTQSCGCLLCQGSIYLYCFQSEKTNLIKVGISKNVTKRRKEIENKLQEQLVLLGSKPSTRSEEARIHRILKAYRTLHPNSSKEKEWFYPVEEVITIVKGFIYE